MRIRIFQRGKISGSRTVDHQIFSTYTFTKCQIFVLRKNSGESISYPFAFGIEGLSNSVPTKSAFLYLTFSNVHILYLSSMGSETKRRISMEVMEVSTRSRMPARELVNPVYVYVCICAYVCVSVHACVCVHVSI